MKIYHTKQEKDSKRPYVPPGEEEETSKRKKKKNK